MRAEDGGRPLLGIELDDKSHQRSDRQARDEFVERVFRGGKAAAAEILVRQAYSVTELTCGVAPVHGLAEG